MPNYIGGRSFQEIEVIEHGRSLSVRARVNIFKTGLGVRYDGGGMRQLVVPYWDNHHIHELLKNDRQPRYGSDTLVHQTLESLFSAIRQTYHILWGNYGVDFSRGAKGKLTEAIELLNQLNLAATGFRTGNFLEWINPFQAQITRLFDLVGTQPRDLYRKEVIAYGQRISCGRDSQGRVNPSALMSQITAAQPRLKKVLAHILAIEPRIIARQQALVSIVQYAEAVIEGARQFLSLLLENGRFREVSDFKTDQTRLDAALTFYRGQLALFDMSPYYCTFFIVSAEFKEAQQKMAVGQFSTTLQLLRRSHESLKLRAIRIELERLLLLLLFHQTVPRRHPLSLEAVAARLALQINHLEGVDETGFALPVRDEALANLRAAALRLESFSTLRHALSDGVFHDQMRLGVAQL